VGRFHVVDDQAVITLAGIVRTFVLQGPRGAIIGVWLYQTGELRAVTMTGHEPKAPQRNAALATVRAYLAGR
jgi:hypothetical protein